MEYRSNRNRKGQTGLNYADFSPASRTKNKETPPSQHEKHDRFTLYLFMQTVAAATVLSVFTIIRLISANFYGEIETGLQGTTLAGEDISQATQQAIDYIQTSETFSQLFPAQDDSAQGNSARWTSEILSDQTEFSMDINLPGVCPIQYTQITSYFGQRQDPFSGEISYHNGWDMAAEVKTAVVSVWDGVVREVAQDVIGGKYVVIDHANGFSTYYGHLSDILVTVGTKISAGETFALSGNTGKTTGPHLHFEIAKNGTPVDPAVYLYA